MVILKIKFTIFSYHQFVVLKTKTFLLFIDPFDSYSAKYEGKTSIMLVEGV